MREHQRDDLAVVVAADREIERRDAGAIGGVRIRTGIEQELHFRGIVDREVERRRAVRVHVLDVAAAGEHASHELRVAVPRREHQRAVAVDVFAARARAALEERSRARDVAAIECRDDLCRMTSGRDRHQQQQRAHTARLAQR